MRKVPSADGFTHRKSANVQEIAEESSQCSFSSPGTYYDMRTINSQTIINKNLIESKRWFENWTGPEQTI